jgi:acyl-CoA thioesterase I
MRPRFRNSLLAAFTIGLTLSACSVPRQPQVIHYTALGAGDALGIGADHLTDGYVSRIYYRVQEQTGRRVQLLNLGIPGAQIEAVDAAFDTSLHRGATPDIVTLWAGATDVLSGTRPQDFDRSLHRLLSKLYWRTRALVIIANVPDLTQVPGFAYDPAVTRQRIAAFNAAIERQAVRFNMTVIHLDEQPAGDNYISDVDGFHPTTAGYAMLTEVFLRAMAMESSRMTASR